MGLSESVDGIISEMLALRQILRRTAPLHRFSEADLKRIEEAAESCEALLKRIREEAGVHQP
ncbi:MAG: hypothetical protein WHS82_06435 [Candidatus Methanosuratincola sp.]